MGRSRVWRRGEMDRMIDVRDVLYRGARAVNAVDDVAVYCVGLKHVNKGHGALIHISE